jgi:hypothetical protein
MSKDISNSVESNPDNPTIYTAFPHFLCHIKYLN